MLLAAMVRAEITHQALSDVKLTYSNVKLGDWCS